MKSASSLGIGVEVHNTLSLSLFPSESYNTLLLYSLFYKFHIYTNLKG